MNRINSVVLPLPKPQVRPLQGLLVAAVAIMVAFAFSVLLLSNMTNYTVGVVVDRTVLFERYLDEVWNKGHLDTLSLFVTDDHIHHDANLDADPVGIVTVTEYIETYRAQLAGLTVSVDQLIVEGDTVSGELTASVNDKTITIPVSSRFADDKIAEIWLNASDVLTALASPVRAQNSVGREIEGLELLEGYPAVQFWFEGYAEHYPVAKDRRLKCSEYIAPDAIMMKNNFTYTGLLICDNFTRPNTWLLDFTYTVENAVIQGDIVVVRYTSHYNYSYGSTIEARTYPGMVMFQLKDGQLAAIWDYYDRCAQWPAICSVRPEGE